MEKKIVNTKGEEIIFKPGKIFNAKGEEVNDTFTPKMGKFICTVCGHDGKPKTITKGNILAELFLWVIGFAFCWFFLVSLIIPVGYSMWRHLSRFKGCRQCHGAMIATNSPVGMKLIKSLKKP